MEVISLRMYFNGRNFNHYSFVFDSGRLLLNVKLHLKCASWYFMKNSQQKYFIFDTVIGHDLYDIGRKY